jgi:hypothetical protein
MKVFKFKLSTRIGSTAHMWLVAKAAASQARRDIEAITRALIADAPRNVRDRIAQLEAELKAAEATAKATNLICAIYPTALMSCRASVQSSGASVVKRKPCEPKSTRLTSRGTGGLGTRFPRPLGLVGSGRKKSRAPPSGGLTHRVSRSVSPTHNPRKNRDSGIPYYNPEKNWDLALALLGGVFVWVIHPSCLQTARVSVSCNRGTDSRLFEFR